MKDPYARSLVLRYITQHYREDLRQLLETELEMNRLQWTRGFEEYLKTVHFYRDIFSTCSWKQQDQEDTEMGAGKPLGIIILIVLLVAAALFMSPELKNKTQSSISNKSTNESFNKNETTTETQGQAGKTSTETSTYTTYTIGETTNEITTSGINSNTTTTTSGTGENTHQTGELHLVANASDISYDPTMESMTVTLNITNTGNDPVTIEEIRVDGYTTINSVLGTTPELPLTLEPGETVSINVTSTVNLITLYLFADYPIAIMTPHGNLTITAKTTRAPGWMSGYWKDDFLTLLTDKVFLEIGIAEPYEYSFIDSVNQTDYGVAETYKLIYNITGNILEQINASRLLLALEDFLQNNNISNLTIEDAYANETYLHASASLVDEGYKHAEVTIIYYQDLNMTQIITVTTEA